MGNPPDSKQRLDGIDLLRGLIMVVMALDHTRDYFTNIFYDPVDLTKTTPGLFFTRWITHYCAPNFIFLAGTGAFLFRTRGKTNGQLAWFLVTRGLWLVFLELTWVRASWMFNWDIHEHGAGVFWSIGWSMVAISALVFLPTSAVAAFGIVMIAFHNTMDNKTAEQVGLPEWLWVILHHGESFAVQPYFSFAAGYKLVPWIGVMAAGYGFGAYFLLEPKTRQREMLGLGAILTLSFVAIRAMNIYGDLHPWTLQKDDFYTFLSFLNCWKYPPSLDYLLMTLGPAIMALAWFDRGVGWLGRPLVIFGRVPLFFYLLHIPLIHGLAVAVDYYRFGWSPMAVDGPWVPKLEKGYGFPLWQVYLIWVGIVIALYPVCYWFARVKQKYRSPWLSYL